MKYLPLILLLLLAGCATMEKDSPKDDRQGLTYEQYNQGEYEHPSLERR